MNIDTYTTFKITCGVLATIGLYSVLYKENKLYRFFEHMFLGLAAGFSLVAIWTETLEQQWWDRMMGKLAEDGTVQQPGYWIYVVLLPIGLMGYLVFSKKHNWMSRIPIGIILGFWSGQQIQVWWNKWAPGINASMLPIWPTTWESITVPNPPPEAFAVYPTQALSNLIFVITILSALSYFFFSFEVKNKLLKKVNLLGRWLLMIGFGAIFGSTVMARFALVIDRMAYIWIEWLQFRILGG